MKQKRTVSKWIRSLVIWAWVVIAAQAFPQVELGKFTPAESAAGSNVGVMVEVEGDLAVAGAWFEDGAAGAAYVYRKVGGVWQQEARLVNPNGTPFTLFGVDVAVSKHPVYGEFVVVGAVFDVGAANPNLTPGGAYVFRNTGSGWDSGVRLPRPDEADYDFFGFTVAASRDLIVVGSPNDEPAGGPSSCGTVYIYRFNGTNFVIEEADYSDPDARISGGSFGEEVKAYSNGTDELIGVSFLRGAVHANGGTAFVLRKVGGVWQRDGGGKIQIPDPTTGDRFAFPTEVSLDWVAIAAGGHDGLNPNDPNCNSGAVYMYRYMNGAWTFTQKIEAPDRANGDRLGFQLLDVSGDLMVVGSFFDDASTGSAYLYRFNGSQWEFVSKLRGSDTVAGDEFGICAVSQGNLILGAQSDDNARGVDAGAVYFFDAFNSPAGANVGVQPMDVATGRSPAILSFSNIVSPGKTTIEIQDQGPPPPSGFKLGTPVTYYEISTTASFTGSVTVCLTWEEGTFQNENNLKLMHYENGAWVNVTTSLDTANNVICGVTTSFSPFIIVEQEPVTQVSIDIKPGSSPNTINLGSNGVVPVAIFGSAEFDATQIDPLSVRLADAAVKVRGNGTYMFHFEDVNGDGRLDMVVQVSTQGLQLTSGDTQAMLTGQTFGGQQIRGTDSVRVVR